MGGRPDKAGGSEETGSVQHLAALAMTGCFRTTSTSTAVALVGLLLAEMAAGKVLVQHTVMATCPGDWRSSAPRASGLHTCGMFGSCCFPRGSDWTGALSGTCRTTRWTTRPFGWRSAWCWALGTAGRRVRY